MGTESWLIASRRVWGWREYLSMPEPMEADSLRHAAEVVAAGGSVFEIANQCYQNPRLHTVLGGRWHGKVIPSMIRRRTNTRSTNPLLSHAVYDATVAALAIPRIAPPQPGPVEQVGSGRYVSTHVVLRGVCGGRFGTSGLMSDGRMRISCLRRRDGAVDRQRHPTMPMDEVETSIVAATITAMGTGGKEKFEAMTLLKRRVVAKGLLTAKIVPNGKHSMGRLVVQRRA